MDNDDRESTSYRWIPTEIQKDILEEQFKVVGHSPTRTRIKHITSLLKVHGNIEAMDVFYWFQIKSHSSPSKCNYTLFFFLSFSKVLTVINIISHGTPLFMFSSFL